MTNDNAPKFTPGPWEIRRHEFVNFVSQGIYSDKSTTGIIADMPYRTEFLLTEYREKFSQEEVDANAALIAAAPEMYALLVEVLQTGLVDYVRTNTVGVMLADEIKALLMKARGEA